MRNFLLATAATMGALLATTGGALAQPVKPVSPGTVVVHLNGYLQFEIANSGSTFNNFTTAAGTDKLNPVTMDGDARLYAGVDGQTLNGIDYGAQIELRTTASDAGVGAGKVTGSNGSTGTESIYVKRAYGYLGTPEAGFVRMGQTDSAFTLFQTGVIEAFGDGAQWNTDGGQFSLLPTNAAPANFIYADASGLYATDKVVYISPTIAGFSVAAGYEPNSNGLKQGYGNNTVASTTSAALAASTSITDIGKRRKNTVDAAVQYGVTSDGFVTHVSAGIIHGAPIAYSGIAPLTPALYGYDDLNVYQVGAQTTYGGLTLGANVKGGQTLDGYAFQARGTRNALTYTVGATYVIGPWVAGASYYNGQTAGSYTPGGPAMARTMSEYGVAVGGNYVISKDLSLFVQYLYGHRHQPGNTALLLHGNAQVQSIATGATFKW
jgi:Gram-negative porin